MNERGYIFKGRGGDLLKMHKNIYKTILIL